MKITVYTIPGCPYCASAKRFLEENNLDYDEIIVPNNKDQRQELGQFGKLFPDDPRGVPVIVFEDNGKQLIVNDENDPRVRDWIKLSGVI